MQSLRSIPILWGKPAYIEKAIEIGHTKIICCDRGRGQEYPLSEKLPGAAVIKARDAEHGIRLLKKWSKSEGWVILGYSFKRRRS